MTASQHDGLVIDPARLERLAAAPGPLSPEECMARAEHAATALDLEVLDRAGAGDALLLWHSDSSEAWLNLWWQERDTGYHDHDGSCVGVYVVEGVARNETLVYGQPRRLREYQRTGRPYPAKARALAVPCAWATAGTPGGESFTGDTFRYSYTVERRIRAPTLIVVPRLAYPHGYRVRVSGATVTSGANAPLLDLRSKPGANRPSHGRPKVLARAARPRA